MPLKLSLSRLRRQLPLLREPFYCAFVLNKLKLLLREPSFGLTRSPALWFCFARDFSETPVSKDQFLCAINGEKVSPSSDAVLHGIIK